MTLEGKNKSPTQQIALLLGEAFSKDNRLLRPVRFKTKTKKDYHITSTSIYTKNPDTIPILLGAIHKNLFHYVKSIDNSMNEIIVRNIEKGSIYDQGQKCFEILGGFSLEIYGFNSESLMFIRVTHEKQISDKKEWISIDIDEIKRSLWFED